MRYHAILPSSIVAAAALWVAVETGHGRGPESPARPCAREVEPGNLEVDEAGVGRPDSSGRVQLAPPVAAASGSARSEVQPASDQDTERASAPLLVRGRVLWAGRPLVEREVSFAPIGVIAGRGSFDAWDLTGDSGEYDAWLAPGRYGIAIDGRANAGTVLEVEAASAEGALDVQLQSWPADS